LQGPSYTVAKAIVTVSRNGKTVAVLHPQTRLYTVQQMPMTDAAIDSGLLGDIYVSLGEPVGDGAWAVRVYRKPLVTWIWGGCVLMALGGFIALADRRYRVRVRRTEPAAAVGEAA